MRNKDYWARRMKLMTDKLLDVPFDYVDNLDEQFRAAEKRIDSELAAWYQRLASNNEISLVEARKLLTKNELKEFHWTVQEYIKYGQENALDQRWMKELENASARVHISRLEAMKLQLQQEAEVLFGNQLDGMDAMARKIYEEGYYHAAFEVQKGIGVGWSLHEISPKAIEKVLSRPWTLDGQTFSDRIWSNKKALINSVNTQLTQMIVTGEAPDKAIEAIAKKFEVSRKQAGRLVMTESAYFAVAAQKDCFNELGVERYQVVASFDHETCGLCGDLDGKVFKMSEYQIGATAPPFHPWCRCCTAPYYEDMESIGERWTRNSDGSTAKIKAGTSFEDWKQSFSKIERPELKKSQNKKPVPKSSLLNVTQEYAENAVPGSGTITYGDGYKISKHKEEVSVAKWLHDTYGGDIVLLNEADTFGVKMPDYRWREKLWELKTTSTLNATDSQVRKALKQIQDNPGGIILDYGDFNIDLEALENVIAQRIARGHIGPLDIIIRAKGKTQKVLRYKKA